MGENGGIGVGALVTAVAALVVVVGVDLALHRRVKAHTRAWWWIETAAWLVIAAVVVVTCGLIAGRDTATELGLGYLIETGISVDNVFLWALVFESVKLRPEHHYKVLTWSIVGASIVRLFAAFIGIELVERLEWLTIVFGVVLLLTGIGVVLGRGRIVEDVGRSRTFKFMGRVLPTTPYFDSGRMISIVNAKIVATPAFLTSVFLARGSFRRSALKGMLAVTGFVLVFVETSDVVLGFETVPAILSVSQQQLIIFVSATVALLGLRPIYFLLKDYERQFWFIQTGIACVLFATGLRLIVNNFYETVLWPWIVLLGLLLAVALGASLLVRRYRRSEVSEPRP